MMVCPAGYGFTPRKVSAMVSPVTVRQSPWSSFLSSSIFISGRMPPMATSSDIKCLPLGFKSASTGTRLPMRVKSSIVSFTFAACAMASRCSTALVEPPSAMTTVMAFSNAFLVRMSSGLNALLQHFHDGGAGAAAIVHLRGRNGVLRGAVRQAHAERFDGAGHGVGGIHAAAGAGAGNGALLDGLKFFVADFFVGVRADGFEDGNDVELACPVSPVMQPGRIVPP